MQVIALTIFYTHLRTKVVSSAVRRKESVKFFDSTENQTEEKITYYRHQDKITLISVQTRGNYMDFNTSLCYRNGTDLKSMGRSNINWQCTCLPGWHGKDCGQPEVVWRALLTYRTAVSINEPRKFQRRVIHIMRVDEYSETLTDIEVNELKECVDLFVLYENGSNFLEHRLKNRFLKHIHHKILYLNLTNSENVIHTVKNVIQNIRDDDIFIMNNLNDILNQKSIMFFKFYNGWPEPLYFRLKYSVYGFFWLHPSKTVLSKSVCTVRYLFETLNDNPARFRSNKSFTSLSNRDFIVGDLNYFGGWFCEYCNTPTNIIYHLSIRGTESSVNWQNVETIDIPYIENLIENGIYLDGKTVLTRSHRFNDNHFAPSYAIVNSWKYDHLLVNMFSKLDYY